MPTTDPSPDLDAFIARWRASSAAERANYVLFCSELCSVLELERPNPQTSDPARDAYVFEKPLPLPHGAVGRIDLYKRGCFVLEAKQGSDALPNPDREEGARGGDPSLTVGAGMATPRRRGTATRNTGAWDVAMERARRQAETYARSLPPAEVADGRPPFLVVIDVGATFEFYSEFTRSGGNYIPFPDPGRHRVTLEELRRPEVRSLLAAVWHDPLTLDPARRSAAVTRAISTQLAALARSLETAHPPDAVAHFLMRCLFTMFAEDVGLLPAGSFTELLEIAHADPASFAPLAAELWRTMKHGGYSVALRRQVAHFNGKLFADADALPLNAAQVALLAAAARADWRDVEPAIFGTLLERALDPRERHKLGAHYTPRAYVERLVWPTVIAPLRQEWDNVKAAALIFQQNGQERLAIQVVSDFQQKLARLRVLDPACGAANFLYVTLEHLKRLEAEVLELLRELGHGQLPLELEGVTVTPAQLLGIEVNPRAAAIAELVLWIGYLQWHYRAERDAPLRQPILADHPAIECRDAVLAWDGTTPLLDDAGQPMTRWDGRTFKRHPVTGEWTPDEHARTPVDRYLNPRPATWPAADFIVGNPPYIGAARMRELLGDGYAEAIRRVYPTVPAAADYVMYWWDKAATLVRSGQVQRFGFITTNSLRQVYDRRVIEHHLSAAPPLALLFAIPDHPWVDAADGAAVRVAMTTGVAGGQAGTLQTVVAEVSGADDTVETEFATTHGQISADLRIGPDITKARSLLANRDMSNRGVSLFGSGFIVTQAEAVELGLGRISGLDQHIRHYRNGRDITATSRDVMVIDLFGLSIDEVMTRFPEVYQHIYNRVKPERDQNRRPGRRENWWIFGEPNPKLRDMLAGLPRYIATVETAKHRVFVFLDQAILPDNKLVAIALDDAWFLGVLSSRIHVTWALAAGSRLGVGNDPVYVKTTCFEKFPFPAADAAQQAHIRALAEQIDAHRKRQQALHPGLTLTDMYNVLEKLRAIHPNPDRQGGANAQGGASAQGGANAQGGASAAESSLTVAALFESSALYQSIPRAYFITFHTYGTWLPGDSDGWTDRAHNAPGTPMLPPDPVREAQARERMDQPEYILDAPRREIVLQTIQEVCQYRGWTLLAAHIRTNHVHVVVHADQAPEKVMTDFKAYASRKLNAGGFESPARKRWTRHGSTRYLWQPAHVEAAIRYVVHKQGAPMAVYENREHTGANPPSATPHALQEAAVTYETTSVDDLPVFAIDDTEDTNNPNPDHDRDRDPNPDRKGGDGDAGDGAQRSLTVAARDRQLTPQERTIHEHAILTILRQLHDELDAAVAAAYGWPADLPDAAILRRLVDLNVQRAAEEAQGVIRWLRPAYQAPRAGLAAPVQATLVEEEAAPTPPVAAAALSWPEAMPAQAAAVRAVLARAARPLSAAEVAAAFAGSAGKRSARVAELLETLAALGQAAVEEGRYAAG